MPQTDKVLRETLSVLKRIVFVGMLIRSEWMALYRRLVSVRPYNFFGGNCRFLRLAIAADPFFDTRNARIVAAASSKAFVELITLSNLMA